MGSVAYLELLSSIQRGYATERVGRGPLTADGDPRPLQRLIVLRSLLRTTALPRFLLCTISSRRPNLGIPELGYNCSIFRVPVNRPMILSNGSDAVVRSNPHAPADNVRFARSHPKLRGVFRRRSRKTLAKQFIEGLDERRRSLLDDFIDLPNVFGFAPYSRPANIL